MRMWMIDPEILCRKHLLGEHNEIHKFRHSFVKGHNMTNRVLLDQIEPMSMESRHDELVAEMLRRGYNHHSPYSQPDLTHYSKFVRDNIVDTEVSLADLINRCPNCKERYEKSSNKKSKEK